MQYYAVTRSNQWLAHHGIKGMKWGVRRYQNEDGTRTEAGKKRYRILRNTKTSNLEKWGKSPNTNVLYVTGHSGSGKSTLAKSFNDKSTSAIHLDSYFDNPTGPHNDRFDTHLKKNLPEYEKLSWPKDKISLDEWGKICVKFENEVENFGRSEYKSNRKVICEGVQLLDDTIRPDKSFFKDKPIVITTTNAFVANHRANKRDNYKYDGIKDVKAHIKYYLTSSKEIKELVRETGAKQRR